MYNCRVLRDTSKMAEGKFDSFIEYIDMYLCLRIHVCVRV